MKTEITLIFVSSTINPTNLMVLAHLGMFTRNLQIDPKRISILIDQRTLNPEPFTQNS